MQRSTFLHALLGGSLALGLSTGFSMEIEGAELDESMTVDGHQLLLNGSGWRRRGYSKTEVVALYLETKVSSFDALVVQHGYKRILLRPLRDILGAEASRFFVSDFERAATRAEFYGLINELSAIGSVFGQFHTIHKGDVITIDWLPGKGIGATINGKSVQLGEGGNTLLNSELMYQILLRIYLQLGTSDEFRMNLFGKSNSMSTVSK